MKQRKRKIVELLLVIPLLTTCNRNNLEDSTWKNCGGNAGFMDILVFNKKYLLVKADTIYYGQKKDSAIAVIDKIEYYYGERRLFIKELKNDIVHRYCEQ